jgi:hypothetical protein
MSRRVVPARSEVTVLEADDVGKGPIGFVCHESIGIGVVNPGSVSKLTLASSSVTLQSFPVFQNDDHEVKIQLVYVDGNVNVGARIVTFLEDVSASHNFVVASFDGNNLFTWEMNEDGSYKETYEPSPENLRAMFMRALPRQSHPVPLNAETNVPALGFFPWTCIVPYMRDMWEVCEVMDR